MDHDQMQCFLSAAKHLSFTKAAEERHMAQTTVSRQVAALEKELGTPLFERRGRALTLTPAGRYMVGTARAYTDQYTRIAAAVRAKSVNNDAPLVLRCGPWESYLLTEPLRKFVELVPGAALSCNSTAWRILNEQLSKGNLSLGFGEERNPQDWHPSLSCHPVYRKPWLVAAAAHHDFWSLPAEQRSRLAGQTVLLSSSPGSDPLRQHLESIGGEHRGYAYGSLRMAQLAMLRAGAGVTLLPPWLPEHLLQGIRTEECLAVPYAPTVMMLTRNDRSHPHLPLLQQLCTEHFEKLGCL
jgi:DNA-binding transcriptional LysR family regulator